MKIFELSRVLIRGVVLIAGVTGLAHSAQAQTFAYGNLVVSRSVYQDTGAAAALAIGSNLPDSAGPDKNNVTTPFKAVADGTYPNVFKNEGPDANFGVTSPIYLDQLTTSGSYVNSYAIPTSQLVTSFPSKSELGLNLSTDGHSLTFMGYTAPVGALDVSNTNTPGIIEQGNYITTPATYRAVYQLNADGTSSVTTTNAYAGNNGRNAILDNTNNQYLTVGNAGVGNGSAQVTAATGIQSVTPGVNASAATPGTTQVGSYNITQNGYTADKPAKDNNYRGETIFNNTLYITKGSGSNGIDTVYQVGSNGTLPTGTGNPISILPGFSTALAKTNANTSTTNFHPFGLFFANASTLYVADEGDGTLADAGNQAKDPNAGLEKWSLNSGTWSLDYTLNLGLNLGTNYTVNDPNTSNTYTAATDGLRNITGSVSNGIVTLYAVTSTVSAATDQGADPNKLVAISDLLSNTSAAGASAESFTTLDSAKYGEVLRGVAFAPSAAAAPEPSQMAAMGFTAAGLLGLILRKRKAGKSQA